MLLDYPVARPPPPTHTHRGKRDALIRQDFPGGFRWPPGSQGQRPGISVGQVNAPPHTLAVWHERRRRRRTRTPKCRWAGRASYSAAQTGTFAHRRSRTSAWHVAVPLGAGCWGICSCFSRLLCAVRRSRGSWDLCKGHLMPQNVGVTFASPFTQVLAMRCREDTYRVVLRMKWDPECGNPLCMGHKGLHGAASMSGI